MQYNVGKLDVKLVRYILFSHIMSVIVDSPVIQYHLQCLELEQAPARWVCKACEASGEVQAKCAWK